MADDVTQQASTQPAQQTQELAKRDAGAIVQDSSEYSMLLDTRKFEQMWRVACLFSKCGMVPTHYKDNPSACFVACQMAMRLSQDPLAFMQNSYVVHNKPGMMATYVIALINSSGLFSEPLQYEISGANGDKGCVAWSVYKANGKRVEGPRVTMAMAKAEGWTANAKWQSLTDLMLTYRSAAFFGRTVCPERLLGMQTMEELEDVELAHPSKQVEVKVTDATPRKKLAERLEKKPTEQPAGSTREPQDQQEPAGDQQPPAGEDQTQGQPAEPPAQTEPAITITDAQCATYEAFYDAMGEIGQAKGMPAPALSALIGKLKVSAMPVAAATRRGVDARREVLQAFAENRLSQDGKILK